MALKRIKYILMAGLSIFMASCYSDYIHLRYDTYYGAQWDGSHTKVVFVASTSAYQQAKGITALPDGGKPKYLLNEVWLYMVDTSTLELNKLVCFNDLAKLMKNRWRADIIYTDTAIYFKVKPTTEWEQYIEWADSHEDSVKILALKEKYLKIHEVDFYNGDIKVSAMTEKLFNQSDFQLDRIGLKELNNILSEVPVAKWGLEIQKINPQPEAKYINDLIYVAKDGSPITKRAIIEQIIAKKNNKEKKAVLNKMDKHKNSLEGIERKEYELYSKEAYKLIKELL